MSELVISLALSLSLIAIGLLCGGMTLHFFHKNLQNWTLARKSKTWPSTPGVITTAEIIWVGARSKSPKPVITYTYQINGISYTGDRIAFDYAHVHSREEANAILERFPVDSHPPIYYNPVRPEESTLEPQTRGLATGLFVNLILLFSPTAFCLCVGVVGLVDTLGR